MATQKTQSINLALTKRVAPYRGPTSSDDWNDTIDEFISSFNQIVNRMNQSIVPLHATLPDGGDDVLVNAFKDGLDGRTLYVDSSLTELATDKTYYNTTKLRPSTLKEALNTIYTYIDTQDDNLQVTMAALVSPITTAQKARIGMNIFDTTKTSDATSLDGKSEFSRLNIIQLAKDLYGESYYLIDDDGNANLSFSVRDMVNALLQAHGGAWNADITLVHSGITLVQTDVGASAIYSDVFAGAPVNLQEDLNQIRTEIKRVTGAAGWTTALTPLYIGGADSLEELLVSTQGSGTKTASNPWGYHYTDVEQLAWALNNIATFNGQAGPGDAAPAYSSNDIVTNGTSLETAIGALDDAFGWAQTPGEFRSGNQFRRIEQGFTGTSVTVVHNQGCYPSVEFLQITPDPIGYSTLFPHYVRHTSLNEFELIITSGLVTSGVVIAQW